jgi:FMN reductase
MNISVSVEWLDLADHSIPLCGGDETYNNTKVKELKDKIQNAKGIIFAVPIYNYDVNAAAKNLI